MQFGASSKPDAESLRCEAVFAGAMDPMTLRFRMVAYDKYSGEKLGVQDDDISFRDALKKAEGLIKAQQHLHLLLEPIGFAH